MGLTARLLACGALRPAVLLVPVPGASALRWAAEDALDERAWRRAESPAQATLLLVCGTPGTELTACVEIAWEGVPGPRVRVEVTSAAEIASMLDEAAAQLADAAAQRRDVDQRRPARLSANDMGGDMAGTDHTAKSHDSGDKDMGDMDMSGDMAGTDHTAMGHDTGDKDMGDMDMGGMDLPGGLRMAGRMADRDGLRLEGLRLSWGPLLPAWPAGLVVDLELSGDVILAAVVRHLDACPEPYLPRSQRALDALAELFCATGWDDGALRARRARAEGGKGPCTQDLLRRLHGARLLRWSLRRLPGPAGGDLCDHLDALISAVEDDADLPAVDEQGLTAALTGLDLGTARIVLAAFGPLLQPAAAHV